MTAQATTSNQSGVIRQSANTITRPPRSLWGDAWHRLLRNKAAIVGAIVILFFAIAGALCAV